MNRLIPILLAVLLGACAAAPTGKTDVPLLETYWKAVELEGAPVEVKAGAREAHLILRREKNMAGGFSGCNTVRGAYEVSGSSLRFKQMASTLMACLPEIGDVERRFNAALGASAGYRISGDSLELRDNDGKVRGRFTAVHLR